LNIGSGAPLKSGSKPWKSYAGGFMEIQKDFKEFFALFNAHKVEYVIVGGYALAFHGVPPSAMISSHP
jgi:hypothetical protein